MYDQFILIGDRLLPRTAADRRITSAPQKPSRPARKREHL